MKKGHFYYINDQYFQDYTDTKLMKNKETMNGHPHNRPCFYAFEDKNTGLYWMIPFSSQVEKYRKYYNTKMQKYHRCDTIVFGNVLGYEKAFLIQNMCPITADYIKNEYMNHRTNVPVRVDGAFERELLNKAKRVLALQRKGIRLILPDVLHIENKLLEKKA